MPHYSSSQSLGYYSQEMGSIPLLSGEEEIELVRRGKAGDTFAYDQLIVSNLRFVVKIANQYTDRGLPLEDLVEEGNMGLVKAAYRFDETRGFRFISYAVWWIRQAINQAVAEQSRTVRIPPSRYWKAVKAVRQKDKLERTVGKDLTYEKYAELLSYDGATFCQEDFSILDPIISLDTPLNGEDGTTLGSSFVDETTSPDAFWNDFFSRELSSVLTTEVSRLSSRDINILTLYYGLNGESTRTLEEIGQLYSLTRERIRQIKKKALERLRESGYSSGLHDFLEEP